MYINIKKEGSIPRNFTDNRIDVSKGVIHNEEEEEERR